MGDFVKKQKERVKRRIAWSKKVIDHGRLDSALKAQKVLPQQLAALIALHNGTYGTCIECGEPIARKRLLLVPAAIRCVQCQTIAEK